MERLGVHLAFGGGARDSGPAVKYEHVCSTYCVAVQRLLGSVLRLDFGETGVLRYP